MTQTCRHCKREIVGLKNLGWLHIQGNYGIAGCDFAEPADPEPDLKHLLRTLFPVAWKADRGRQDPELMAAYVEVQKVLGLTKEEIEEMSR